MSAKIINLFGASGSGKSSGAAYIFSMLKLAGINCELVTEFAKDKVWDNNMEAFKSENQVYMFGNQFYRVSRLLDKVDYIITDSPILLSNVYNKSDMLSRHFMDAVRDCHNSLENINYYIERVKPFNPIGRNEKCQADSDKYISNIFYELDITNSPYEKVRGDIDGYNKIVEDILKISGVDNNEH